MWILLTHQARDATLVDKVYSVVLPGWVHSSLAESKWLARTLCRLGFHVQCEMFGRLVYISPAILPGLPGRVKHFRDLQFWGFQDFQPKAELVVNSYGAPNSWVLARLATLRTCDLFQDFPVLV